MKRLFILIAFLATLASPLYALSSGDVSPVTDAHLLMIESLLRDNRLTEATARLDQNGQVLLGGSYKDSNEVALAFSLAQSVVGVKWTSPVTPENVRIRKMAQSLSSLFPKTKERPGTVGRKVQSRGVPERFALIVGVSKFGNDAKGKNTLKYAAKDAREVESHLVAYNDYKKDNIITLVNSDATRSNIQKALDKIRDNAQNSDEVFIYFSSHGAPVYDGSLNIVTYDTEFKTPYAMASTSYSAKSLQVFLEGVSAERVFVILDVCYSGAAFKGIEGFYYSGSKSIHFEDDNQGYSKEVIAKSLLGAKDVTLDDDVVKLPSRSGTKVVITASGAGEKSWESDSIKGSFFTHHFLQEFRKNKGVRSAFAQAKPRVTSDVRKEKHAEQTPQAVASRMDWGI